MAVGTGWAQGTVSFAVCFADGNIAGKAEAEALAEEWGEGEVVVVGVAGVIC